MYKARTGHLLSGRANPRTMRPGSQRGSCQSCANCVQQPNTLTRVDKAFYYPNFDLSLMIPLVQALIRFSCCWPVILLFSQAGQRHDTHLVTSVPCQCLATGAERSGRPVLYNATPDTSMVRLVKKSNGARSALIGTYETSQSLGSSLTGALAAETGARQRFNLESSGESPTYSWLCIR